MNNQINIIQPRFISCEAYLDFQANLQCTYSLYPASLKEAYFQCLSYSSRPSKARLSMVAGLLVSHLTSRGFASFLLLITDFHLYTYFARILTSYISISMSLIVKPLLFSSLRSSLYSLFIVVDLTQSVQKGWQSYPAKSQRTQLAIAIPIIAGIVPRTGIILMRQLSNTLNDSGYFYCYSLRGNSYFYACWQEYATFIPLFMPFFVSSRFSRIIRLSYLHYEISRICKRVGSLFIPAPPEHINLIFRSLHRRTTSTLASRLSIQSTTQLALSTSNSEAFCTVTQAQTVQIQTWGSIRLMYFLRHQTLGVPTSSRRAQLWRFKLLRLTRSKSTILIFFTPERASILTTCDPTPPTPKTSTQEFSIFQNFYSPKYLMTLANCQLFN